MTVYERFLELGLEAPFLVERESQDWDYFCTPVGAKVFGSPGVDGIHYCFVPEYGDMVFAVDPVSYEGNYVFPLARSFADFIRLILACGSDAAVEQITGWDREQFREFLKEQRLEAGEQAVLERLSSVLDLTPMEDPFSYVKELQAGFDGSKLRFSPEYGEILEELAPKPQERKKWQVWFGCGFWDWEPEGKPGSEIPLGKEFSWGEEEWKLLSVYQCSEGLTVDFCVAVSPERVAAFHQKWVDKRKTSGETAVDPGWSFSENPLHIQARAELTCNGRLLRWKSSSSLAWEPSVQSGEGSGFAPRLAVEHYGCDASLPWVFLRFDYPWDGAPERELHTLSFVLKRDPAPRPGPRFEAVPGKQVAFVHPVTGAEHLLTVEEVEREELPENMFPKGDLEYPRHLMGLSFRVKPELPPGELSVQDCARGDNPRPSPDADPAAQDPKAFSVGIIGGADGPAAIYTSGGGEEESFPRQAVSSLYFNPPEHVQWKLWLRVRTHGDKRVEVELS